MKSFLTTIYLFFFFISSYAQNAVTIGNLRLEATYEHISVLYNITNDDNRNSSLTIEYRPQGSTEYLMGAKTMRAHPSSTVDGNSLGRNHLAGSAMFLQPGTTYDLRLTVTDPDGGGGVEMRTWQTNTELTPAANSTTYYVAPGNGGGDGSMNNPFLGLQTAADNAAPGTIFMVMDGTYAPFTLTTNGTDNNPIVFQSQNQHGAIIDGGNTDRGIVNIGDFEQSTEEIIMDGFIIQNGAWGINAENTAFLTIKNNIIRDVDFGFINRREIGLEHDQTIENNIITGRNQWPASGIPPERGIDIRGNNNVIRYNTIQYFGDGISTDGRAHERSFSLDIHHNDIAYCPDDAIEVDFTVANTRIYRNRCYNTRTGVSVAPVFGGPCYIFRNEFFNQEDGFSTYKMNRGPSGLVMVHNTSNKHGYGMSSPAGWQNTYFRNNIIMGTGYVFEEYGLVANSVDDWNYNAFYSTRAGAEGIGNQWFKWDDVRYADLAALQAGTTIETNGIAINLSDFNNATLPATDETGVEPGDRDLTLVNGAAARNSGAVLDNINLPFVSDGQPDRGAFEFGQPYPEYGANFMPPNPTDQNAVTIGNLRLEATYEHISVLYNVTNDDNRNSSLTIEYRPQGTTEYLMGAKTVRAHPSSSVDGNALGRNHLAGSAMFLQPATTYDLRLTVTDPDGGGGVEMRTWQTNTELTPATDGTIYYVAPGNGGGNGTMNNPFLGLQTAADNAAPGNIFRVMDGTYAPFTLTVDGTNRNPIVFQSQNQHGAIIDGGNTDRGIVNIGDFEQSTEEIIMDGFIIQNGAWGINAENTAFLTIKNNIIRDVDFGFINRREIGLEHDQTIENNIFTGRTPWPSAGIPGERGIDIRGNNNVIRYNTIQYFGDGISTDGRAYERSFSLDIHHNDIAYCPDDAIEVDFTVANTRIYRNRCYNTRTGVSVAPVFGGPCYIFRNEFFNQEDGFSTYKMNRGPSGLVMAHNTSNKHGYGMSSPAGWQNTYLRNNIIMGTGYVFEEYGIVDNSIDDWDYNAFYSDRAGADGIGNQWFKWDDVRYPDLAALQAGTSIETNGIVLNLSDFNNATLPATDETGVTPGDRDLRLVNDAAARNSGAVLDNINLPFVMDGQPDRGAFEFGQPYPEYGASFGNDNEDCPINDEISGTIPTQDYIAQNQITSTGIIPASHVVTFSAGASILLNAGFHASAGASFYAEIKDINCQLSLFEEELPISAKANIPKISRITPQVVVYPNPFSNSTTIEYELQEDGVVDIAIFDIGGRQLLDLEKGFKIKGQYKSRLSASELSGGLYFVKVRLGRAFTVVKIYVIE